MFLNSKWSKNINFHIHNRRFTSLHPLAFGGMFFLLNFFFFDLWQIASRGLGHRCRLLTVHRVDLMGIISRKGLMLR